MCEVEGRKREECFLLMTGTLLFIGLGVSAEFCGLGGQVMSALETTLVSVTCAAPPFPRSPYHSFKRDLPVSCFHRAKLFWLVSWVTTSSHCPADAEKRGLGYSCLGPPSSGLALLPEVERKQDSPWELGFGVWQQWSFHPALWFREGMLVTWKPGAAV